MEYPTSAAGIAVVGEIILRRCRPTTGLHPTASRATWLAKPRPLALAAGERRRWAITGSRELRRIVLLPRSEMSIAELNGRLIWRLLRNVPLG